MLGLYVLNQQDSILIKRKGKNNMFNVKNKKNRKEVISFLKRNPNPNDMKLHSWAERKKYNVHKVEELIYRIATEHVKEKHKKGGKR
jgi:hypothetical protein